MLNRLRSRGRVRAALRQLARDPSTKNYIQLAQAHAAIGELEQVRKVCEEGLDSHPGNVELLRLVERVTQIRREDRVRELQKELREAPRAAVWRELCEIHLDAGRVARAEEVAAQWFEQTRDGEANYYEAKARAERFFCDRRRDDGRKAFDLVDAAIELMPADPRPLRLRLLLASRSGAWGEARTTIAQLLELFPGDAALEARFRTIINLSENCATLDQALRAIERSGRLIDDDPESERQPTARSVRPMLQRLASDSRVRGAFYVRGATALVQGLRGATAERTARGIRELMSASRTASRRLGLGHALDVRIEGRFGTLLITPGVLGAGALWTKVQPAARQEEFLRELTSIAESRQEIEE